MTRCSRVPGFYKLSVADRLDRLAEAAGLGVDDAARLRAGELLDRATADHMIDNVIGTYPLPLGIGLNFQVNGADYLVPMCVEEPSVVAAASNAAKMVRAGGGFVAEADDPIMISQVQITGVADTDGAKRRIEAQLPEILKRADEAQPGLLAVGGGTRGAEVRILEASSNGIEGQIVVHLFVDCRDAMGANSVNTMAERVSPRLAELAGGTIGLRILSNLADRRCVRVRARVPFAELATDAHDGAEVARGVVSASRFAELDPYRAATHNKGIMNGIDAAVIATGNDWRGIEAGAHSFAARSGTYRPLAIWRLVDGFLEGRLEMPMALGTVGGATKVHPGARLALAILGIKSATELGMVIASAGMASNLAALRALASEGIQRGHMTLHARTVAASVGATGDLVDRVARELFASGDIRPDRAAEILSRLRTDPTPQGAAS